MTLRQYMNGQTTRELGVCWMQSEPNALYQIRLRYAHGIGCIAGEIRPKGGKWQGLTGRFGEDCDMCHFINHMKDYNLADGATVMLSPGADAAYKTDNRIRDEYSPMCGSPAF